MLIAYFLIGMMINHNEISNHKSNHLAFFERKKDAVALFFVAHFGVNVEAMVFTLDAAF